MSISEQDVELIERCLTQDKHAWEDFVDRYLRIVTHVANHTVRSRGFLLPDSDRDDLVAEVFLEICRNDYGLLRRFRGESSFSSYLTVISRRIIVGLLVKRSKLEMTVADPTPWMVSQQEETADPAHEDLLQLLSRLNETESRLIQLHHLEGLSYQQISERMGMPENSVGPALSRARNKMRQAHSQTTAESLDSVQESKTSPAASDDTQVYRQSRAA